jgi:hypothetical protein
LDSSQIIKAIIITTIIIPVYAPALKISPTSSQLDSNVIARRATIEYNFFMVVKLKK